jgi:tRNA(His) guanylyltransferase
VDSLGDRIKRYEAASNPLMLTKTPIFIRVDGKAFHTWTKYFDHPFDQGLIDAMVQATIEVSQEMMGFKLAYVQSDEATFCLTDLDTHQTQAWFGGELNKLVSVTASMFTAYFNSRITNGSGVPALFDARAFNVPLADAPNAFIWRQKDWERNSLQMLARSQFTHRALDGKKHADIHEMLHERGINWANLSKQLKNGTFVLPGGRVEHETWDWSELIHYIDPDPEED